MTKRLLECTAFLKSPAYNPLLLAPAAIMPPQSFNLPVHSCVGFVGNFASMGAIRTAWS